MQDDPHEPLTLAALAVSISEMYKQLSIDEIMAAASAFVMQPRGITYDDLWKEWFSFEGSRPLIYCLERFHPKWRAKKGAILGRISHSRSGSSLVRCEGV